MRERWAAIAPDLAGRLAPVGYDSDSGWLTVCPESMAWATKARPGAGQLCRVVAVIRWPVGVGLGWVSGGG
nr:hypothetical protein [Streptomyces sp. SAJ15]